MSTDHAPGTSRSPGRDPHRGSRGLRDGRAAPGYDVGVDEDADFWEDEADAVGAPPQILWGRIAFFGLALLLVFVLGRVTAGGGDEAAAAAQLRVDELTAELEQARAEIDALEAGGAGADAADTDAPAATGAGAAQETDTAAAAESDEVTDEAGSDAAQEAPVDGADDEAAAQAEPGATTYTVQPGDYLFGLAERFYNNGRQWQVISEANNLGPGAVISPGQTLTIPPAP